MSKNKKTMKKSLRHFWEFRIYKRCKETLQAIKKTGIKIGAMALVGATALMGAGEAKGQARPLNYRTESSFIINDIPSTRASAGAHAKLSIDAWRFTPYIKMDQSFSLSQSAAFFHILDRFVEDRVTWKRPWLTTS